MLAFNDMLHELLCVLEVRKEALEILRAVNHIRRLVAKERL
jgi:hypothetical protein